MCKSRLYLLDESTKLQPTNFRLFVRHKLKRISDALRSTNALFICLFKVINVSPPCKIKNAYTFTKKAI